MWFNKILSIQFEQNPFCQNYIPNIKIVPENVPQKYFAIFLKLSKETPQFHSLTEEKNIV